MDNTINGRTPEEIKKGLECRKQGYAEQCGYGCSKCDVYVPGWDLINDTLAYIQQLECERDAAVEELKEVDLLDLFRCSHCKHEELCDETMYSCSDCDKDCPCSTCVDCSNWQWRGVQEVE